MKIIEKLCKTCLGKSRITDYTLNPYVGCEHGCKYCYANYMKRWLHIEQEWGNFVVVKINAPEILKKELAKLKTSNPGNLWIGSVCDCYMPLENKYKLTRQVLEAIKKSGKKFDISLLTKSKLAERDFDLFKALDIELGVSIGNADDRSASIIEPNASLPSERLEIIRKAREKGIRAFAFISPVIPGISDLEQVFKELSKTGCKSAWIEILNVKKSVVEKLEPLIKENLPKQYENFKAGIENYSKFCKETETQARVLEKKYKIEVGKIVVHQRDFS